MRSTNHTFSALKRRPSGICQSCIATEETFFSLPPFFFCTTTEETCTPSDAIQSCLLNVCCDTGQQASHTSSPELAWLAASLLWFLLHHETDTTTRTAKCFVQSFKSWAAQYNTWLLIQLMPKVVVFSFLFYKVMMTGSVQQKNDSTGDGN